MSHAPSPVSSSTFAPVVPARTTSPKVVAAVACVAGCVFAACALYFHMDLVCKLVAIGVASGSLAFLAHRLLHEEVPIQKRQRLLSAIALIVFVAACVLTGTAYDLKWGSPFQIALPIAGGLVLAYLAHRVHRKEETLIERISVPKYWERIGAPADGGRQFTIDFPRLDCYLNGERITDAAELPKDITPMITQTFFTGEAAKQYNRFVEEMMKNGRVPIPLDPPTILPPDAPEHISKRCRFEITGDPATITATYLWGVAAAANEKQCLGILIQQIHMDVKKGTAEISLYYRPE